MRKRFLANRNLVAGSLLLGLYVFFAIFADFITPYDPAAQVRDRFFAPPTVIRFRDSGGRFAFRPHVYNLRLADRQQIRYIEERDRAYPLKFFVSGQPYRLFGLIRCKVRLFGTDEPAGIFLFGTDALGRDVFSRIGAGARLSMTLAVAALLIAFPLALFFGSLAGFYGGIFDFLSQRFVELFQALPALYLIIAMRSALPLSLPPEQVFYAMTGVLALFGWGYFVRIVRGAVLSLREQDFIQAAVAIGASERRIIFRHLLPHLTGILLTHAAMAVPGFILAEITLSYLGLGVQEPLSSLGNMLSSVGGVRQLGEFWWNLAPCGVIFIISMGFYLLAEGLRESFDPRAGNIDSLARL